MTRVKVKVPYQVVTRDGAFHYGNDVCEVDQATAETWARMGWVAILEPAEAEPAGKRGRKQSMTVLRSPKHPPEPSR